MLKPWDLSVYSDEDANNYANVEDLIWSFIISLIGNEASKHDDADNEWINELLNHADDVRQYAAKITVSPTQHASKQLHTRLSTILVKIMSNKPKSGLKRLLESKWIQSRIRNSLSKLLMTS